MKVLGATLLGLAGFATVNALVHPLLDGRPELRLLRGSPASVKVEHLRLHPDDYDVIYLGTSRVHHGFAPEAFDARMAEQGLATRSYNFGLVGMDFLEEFFLVDWILENRSPGLRWLLIEPTEREVLFEPANLFSARIVSWHDVATTRRAIESTWRSKESTVAKLERTRLHLLHAAQRLSNIGVGANLLARALGGPDSGSSDSGGSYPGTQRAGEAQPAPRERPAGDGMIRIPAVLWTTIGAMAHHARAAQVQPFFVVPPTNRSMAHFRLAADARAMPNLLLPTPTDLPGLYADRKAHFRDQGHLNELGARAFSSWLAESLAQGSRRRR